MRDVGGAAPRRRAKCIRQHQAVGKHRQKVSAAFYQVGGIALGYLLQIVEEDRLVEGAEGSEAGERSAQGGSPRPRV